MQPYLESEHTILEISYPISKSKKNKPAAQEKAHLQTAKPGSKAQFAKELFPSLFFPPPKKNKFPSATPTYLQLIEQKSTAYNIALAKWRVKCKVESFCIFSRRMCSTFSFF